MLRANHLVRTRRASSRYVSYRMNSKGSEVSIKIEIISCKKSIPKIKV